MGKEKFENLMKDIKKCTLCEKRFGFKPHPVIYGKYNSKIVHISQAPSKNVHKSLKPFTDISGKKLIHEWYQITEDEFYDKNNFYFTALAHCYPGKNKGGGDRVPPKVCFDTFIKKEVELINNKIYIIVGSKASKIFFKDKDFNELVFSNNYLNGKLALVLPHPSPLNIKWFKDNPRFMKERIFEIRKIVNAVINE